MNLEETLRQIDDLSAAAKGLYQSFREEHEALMRRHKGPLFKAPLFGFEEPPHSQNTRQLRGETTPPKDYKWDILDTYLQTTKTWLEYYDQTKKVLEETPTNERLMKKLTEQLETFERQLQSIKKRLEEKPPPSESSVDIYRHSIQTNERNNATNALLNTIKQYTQNEQEDYTISK